MTPFVVGVDIRGGQPTGGNIKGGLTSIEEKSLGAIAKAGSAPIQAVYEYGEILQTKAEISGYIKAMDIYTIGPVT